MSIENLIERLIQAIEKNNDLLSSAASDRARLLEKTGEKATPAKRGRPPKTEAPADEDDRDEDAPPPKTESKPKKAPEPEADEDDSDEDAPPPKAKKSKEAAKDEKLTHAQVRELFAEYISNDDETVRKQRTKESSSFLLKMFGKRKVTELEPEDLADAAEWARKKLKELAAAEDGGDGDEDEDYDV